MKRFVTTAVLALCAASAPAIAQVPAQARPAPLAQSAPVATRDVDPNALANAALQMLQVIDRGQAGALWDNASAVAQRATGRADFVGHLGKTRAPLGAAASRSWMSVRRESVPAGGRVPPGHYANIEFASQFQGQRTAKELISLRRDEDGQWRFSGYVIE
ncbi:DUF4019 domain-containing protein [Lysobacter sp. K5869]|uniref:DUF4019 domain-containing protein n=1 Tax=Lysobacter sp. K5869 TaxID=2820808 RepID=UPI001C06371E|nr:DUF4019 domain-containing protein [Lysobacter sp. K5869]QWP75308.1 DUF4019 domain-containing protein [Lysobacter sp. K5869]